MILVSHPTGNTFVRALLAGLLREGMLCRFQTALAFSGLEWWMPWAPAGVRATLLRRRFDLPRDKIATAPVLEIVRMFADRLGMSFLTRHETSLASVDAVYRAVDRAAANALQKEAERWRASGIYAYEDGALESFRMARRYCLPAYYDLPIAYWELLRRLLDEEAQRLPGWAPTMVGVRDSAEKYARKTEEIELASMVFCPSRFVLNSIPERIRAAKPCIVAEFGSPSEAAPLPHPDDATRKNRPLRALFAGSLTQRKGLGDLFAALKLLKRSDIELVVMGTPAMPIEAYRRFGVPFTYEPPRPNAEVLRLMRTCDVFVLPSIVEGRALVQQEAMMQGLPLIVTPNAGGEDLVEKGKTGFLVPIRSPEDIAEKLDFFADHRDLLPEMGRLAQAKAAALTWEGYAGKIIAAIRSI